MNVLPADDLGQIDNRAVALVEDPPELGEVDNGNIVDGFVVVEDGGDRLLEPEHVLNVDFQGLDGEGGAQGLVLNQLRCDLKLDSIESSLL